MIADASITSDLESPLLSIRAGSVLHQVQAVDRNWWWAVDDEGQVGLVYQWFIRVQTPPADGQFILWHDQEQGLL